MRVRRAVVKQKRARRGHIEALLDAKVLYLQQLGPGKALRIDPTTANPYSIAGKIVDLRKVGKAPYVKIRVTIIDGAAFLYIDQIEKPGEDREDVAGSG